MYINVYIYIHIYVNKKEGINMLNHTSLKVIMITHWYNYMALKKDGPMIPKCDSPDTITLDSMKFFPVLKIKQKKK